MRIVHSVVAELVKLRGLPAATLVSTGTVLAGGVVAAALAASAADQDVTAVVVQTVPFTQVGLVLLGILPAVHEYAGRQIRTSLVAVPNRVLLLAGKTGATLLVVTATAAATIGASLLAAAVTRSRLDAPAPAFHGTGEPGTLAGAVAYLALIALLSHAVAVLSRHLVPALVGMLGLVLIVSPLLAGFTEHARWLPDRAGARLYDPTDPVLTAITGPLVLCGWISVTGAAAIVRFIRSDS